MKRKRTVSNRRRIGDQPRGPKDEAAGKKVVKRIGLKRIVGNRKKDQTGKFIKRNNT